MFEETKSWHWSNHEDFNSCSSISFSVPEITEMTSGENVEGDVLNGGENREDVAVTPPRTEQNTTQEMVISPHRYDDSGEPRRFRPLSEVYAETKETELEEGLLFMGVDEPLNYEHAEKDKN